MKSRAAQTLTVKCPTWDHVDAFHTRKVSEDGGLSARLPFHPQVGDALTIALELPDQTTIAIEAQVERAAPAADGVRSAVRLRLIGLTAVLREHLAELVAEARRERQRERDRESTGGARGGAVGADAEARRRPASRPPPAAVAAAAGPEEEELPPPLPTDAPVDEVVAPRVLPAAADVPAEVRPLFEQLERDLHRMRTAAAHDVLGVKWKAEADEIRRAYFELSKRLHPDLLARHRSPAIDMIGSEVFIAVNRAYDRMRAAAVASGGAIAAGPDLLPHEGWVAGFEDIGTAVGVRAPSALRAATVGSPTASGLLPVGSAASGSLSVGSPAASGSLSVGSPASGGSLPVGSPASGGSLSVGSPGASGLLSVGSPGASGSRAVGSPPAGGSPSPAPRERPAEKPRAPTAAGTGRPDRAQPLRSRPDSGGSTWRSAGGGPPPRPSAEVLAEARQLIAGREWGPARELLAESLRRDPRNRKARALYHLASAEALLESGKPVDARTQLEVALAHDPELREASAAIDRMRQQEGPARAGLLGRLFR